MRKNTRDNGPTMKNICIATNCDKEVVIESRGMCRSHHQVWCRENKPRDGFKPCAVEDCDGVLYAKALCRIHYARMKANGTTELLPLTKAPVAICIGPNCDRVAKALSMCQAHYCQHWAGKELKPLQLPHPIIQTPEGAFKQCKTCEGLLPVGQFYSRSGAGRQTECKTCMITRNRARTLARRQEES